MIHPLAAADEVEEFLRTMGWENIADEPFSIREKLEGEQWNSSQSNSCSRKLDQSLPASLPKTFTLRTLFTRYLDFNAVPRRTFFQYLRDFTSDDLEREKLEEFLSKEGAVSWPCI